MKTHHLHNWRVSIQQAFDIQKKLAASVSQTSGINEPHLVAGVDISVNRIEIKAYGIIGGPECWDNQKEREE